MGLTHNRKAGISVARLAALADNIFAVAMTLLVLDLRIPTRDLIHSSPELARALWALAPQFVTYLISFLTLGIFWVGQHAMLNVLHRGDRNLSWLSLAFLAAVSIVPFSTRILAEFFTYRAAIVLYWINILILGSVLYCTWRYSHRAGLLSPEHTDELRFPIERRIISAQIFYALGASLCLIDNRLSIAVIFLVQLSFVLGFRLPIKHKPRTRELPGTFPPKGPS